MTEKGFFKIDKKKKNFNKNFRFLNSYDYGTLNPIKMTIK